jgi:hypothetical protein
VYNPAAGEEAYFFIVHAPHEGYDFVPVDFRHLQPALTDSNQGAPSDR